MGLTEAEAREQHGDTSPSAASRWSRTRARSCPGETTGWVKSIHETTYGELLGVVMVGPHATDLIEAAVVALDAEATVETVADGMAPHPTLSEAFKEAGLVAPAGRSTSQRAGAVASADRGSSVTLQA